MTFPASVILIRLPLVNRGLLLGYFSLESANYSSQGTYVPPPVFASKFSWNTAVPIHFCITYDSFHVAMAELNSCDSMACKAYDIYYPALYRKSLPILL